MSAVQPPLSSAVRDAAAAVEALTVSASANASAGEGLAQQLVQGSASPAAIRAKLVSKEPQIIKLMQRRMAEGKPFYSFEYFPPKTREGVTNLYSRLDRMDLLEPLFMDLTWGAGGSNSDLALEIAGTVQGMCAAQMMLHLTCTNMRVAELKDTLDRAKKLGIRNILALRGDPPKGMENWESVEDGFETAAQLVKFIRQEYGDWFGIGVSGYPEGHVSCKSLEEDIKYLKEKVDAGADFIITQLFYDVDLYFSWVDKIRAIGVKCPVIPGIMPIQNYNGFIRMTGFCKTHVPADISEALERIKDDDDAVKQYGIDLGITMCRKLLAKGTPGLHFYTLNLERSVAQILEGLGLITSKLNGRLPWKQSLVTLRSAKEDVRPIFWANRPRSYLERTIHWDEFPNGRWGDSTSPAFGDLSDYHLAGHRAGTLEERRALWGAGPEKPVDLFKVFEGYITGSVARLPWCDLPIQLETVPLKEFLARMCAAGFLTINSQPAVNGAPSADPAVGWGGPGGYVYQKAYIEFFASPSHLARLMKIAAEHPAISITALSQTGDKVSTVQAVGEGVSGARHVNAVTWGVFPNREIVQPTVVDQDSFSVWKDEAFALWLSQWAPLYEEGSASRALIQEVHDSYYLVNCVDNDYVKGDLQAFFNKVMQ